jgi:hypothetical protein
LGIGICNRSMLAVMNSRKECRLSYIGFGGEIARIEPAKFAIRCLPHTSERGRTPKALHPLEIYIIYEIYSLSNTARSAD